MMNNFTSSSVLSTSTLYKTLYSCLLFSHLESFLNTGTAPKTNGMHRGSRASINLSFDVNEQLMIQVQKMHKVKESARPYL